MKVLLPLTAAIVLGATPLLAGGDSFSGPATYREANYPAPEPLTLYERIVAHYAPMGREVREEFRDGPCRIERHWERDGDYEEKIECRGPRH
ncbi:MAG: hypothetical protein WC807_20645 [Hyphomicrobium sp.]